MLAVVRKNPLNVRSKKITIDNGVDNRVLPLSGHMVLIT